MIFHDAHARRTPLELALPDLPAARARMAAIAAEAEARGVDTGDLGAFALLGSAAALLREVVGTEGPAEAPVPYAALLFHAYHVLRAGAPVHLVTVPAARALASAGDWGSAAPASALPPAEAGYAQLPRNLFWIQTGQGKAAEAVDGFFWLARDGRLLLLLATGVMEGRPGVGVVPIPEAPLEELGTWIGAAMREEGEDFATTLPGGELDGLHSLVTAGEVLKLAARLFALLGAHPGAVEPGGPVPEGAMHAPSALPWVRVVLPAPAGGAAEGARRA